MQDKHGSTRFPVFGTEVVKLFNSRYRIVVRCDVSNRNEDWYYANQNSFWKDFGDLYTASLDVDAVDDGWNVRDGEAYPDMRLVRTEFGFLPTRPTPVLTFVYETLPSTFTQEVADKVDYELNGLRRVTRSVIAKDGATYTKVVGTDTISHNEHEQGPKTLTLGSAVEAAKSESEGGFVRYIETWYESGILSELVSNGPSSLPNTKTKSIRSIGVKPSSDGILLSKSEQNINGLIFYDYSFLESSAGGNPTFGVLQTYQDVIEIKKPGVVSARIINEVAEIEQTPPRKGKVAATVTVSLTTDSTVSVPVAFNLDDTSCSATLTQTRVTPVGVEQGNSLTVSVFNTRRTATVRPFPDHYYSGDGASNSYTTPATIIRDNDNIIGESLNETHSSSVSFSGSNIAPATTGIYDEQVEPAFLDDAGVQYYRKTTYTI